MVWSIVAYFMINHIRSVSFNMFGIGRCCIQIVPLVCHHSMIVLYIVSCHHLYHTIVLLSVLMLYFSFNRSI
jgi:hypothetical protein